jgi:hypothetical protein
MILSKYPVVLCENGSHKDPRRQDQRKTAWIRNARKRQTILEQNSLRILERMNEQPDMDELRKLSMDMTSVCKQILEIQETIHYIDTHMLYSDTMDGLEL